jgi:glycosyltransferase involved in cell wall biosynthesis
MNRTPFFSIIIPTYNRRSLLPQTLESVFSQTFRNYEVVVIDNGSNDNTEELISNRYKSTRLKYFRYEQNLERAWARNTGMSKCSGIYATFLDSDDFIYPTALEDAYSYYLNNSDIKIFHNRYELVDDEFATIYRYHFPSLRNQHKALASGNFLSCIGIFMHREIYQKYSFDIDPLMTGSEDFELWLRILSEYKLGRIDRVNSGIRHHQGRSVNHSAYDSLEYQSRKIIRMINTNPTVKRCYEKYVRRLEASFLLMRSIAVKQKGHNLKAWRLLLQAVACEPSVIFTMRPYRTAYNLAK